MIEAFLRRPETAGTVVADILRILGLVSVLVAAFLFSGTDAGILAFTLPALLLPRFLGLRGGFDAVYCAALLAAAWSNVIDLYRILPWWDIPMHLVCTGALAALCYAALERFDVIDADPPRARRRLVLMPALGLALGTLWEIVEWIGKTFISDAIVVSYQDTIGDLAVGGVGAFVAALLVMRMPIE